LAYYKVIDTNPQYYWREGRLYSSPAGNNPADMWHVKPAVVRDMDYPISRAWAGGWLTNVRDFYASEVDVGVDTGLMIKTSLYDESELLVSLASYLKQNEPKDED
jgi:hypothetical protein